MEYILLIFLLLNTSLFYSTIFNKKIEQTIFLSIFSYIFILFVFGIFSILNVGFITILILNGILFIINVHSFIKRKIDLNKNVLTTGLILFIISYLIIVWQSFGKLANSWDEFSHWALVVKNMYGLGNLGLGSDSTVMIKTYLSGTSLFQYFCTKLCGEFRESMLYVGMDLLIISLIVPIFKTFKKKNNFLGYILYFILFFLPTFFYPTVYQTLYVDAVLGLAFAYSLYSYFSNRKKSLDKFDIINLIASFSMLILIKDFGLVLMLIAFAIILIDNMFIRNKFNIKNIVKDNYLLFITILPALLIKIVWIITLTLNNVNSSSSGSSIINTVKNLITLNLMDYQTGVITSFADATFNTSLTSTFIPLSYVTILIITIIIGYFLIRNTKKESKNTNKVLVIFSILGAIAYSGLLLVAYLAIFSEYEAARLASFTRYMGTYALGLLYIVIALYVDCTHSNEKNLGVFTMLLLTFFTINFSFSTFLNLTVFASANSNITKDVREPYKEFRKKSKKYIKKNDYLYFISTNDNGIDYYIARYELTPYKMNKNFAWSIGVPYSKEDIWTVYKTSDTWRQELIKEYDYVYLFDIDEKFIDQYNKLFINGDIKDNQLYKVVKSDSYAILEFVE